MSRVNHLSLCWFCHEAPTAGERPDACPNSHHPRASAPPTHVGSHGHRRAWRQGRAAGQPAACAPCFPEATGGAQGAAHCQRPLRVVSTCASHAAAGSSTRRGGGCAWRVCCLASRQQQRGQRWQRGSAVAGLAAHGTHARASGCRPRPGCRCVPGERPPSESESLTQSELTPVLSCAVHSLEAAWAPGVCFLLFVAASVTDWLDGYLARKARSGEKGVG